MESSHSACCHLQQIWVPGKMDSPAPAPDNIKEGCLVLLLILVEWVFLFPGGRKNWNANKSVPGAVHLCTVPSTGLVAVLSA